jgi:hypothetical protein
VRVLLLGQPRYAVNHPPGCLAVVYKKRKSISWKCKTKGLWQLRVLPPSCFVAVFMLCAVADCKPQGLSILGDCKGAPRIWKP